MLALVWVTLKGVPWRVWGALGACAAVLGGVWYYGYAQRLQERHAWEQKEAAYEARITTQNKQFADAKAMYESEISAVLRESALELGIARAKKQVVTNTIIKEIPNALPQAVVNKYPLPNGFVRLVDAAATSSELPRSTSTDLDSNPSSVGIDVAASVTVRNYGKCYTVEAERDRCIAERRALTGASKAFTQRTKGVNP